MIGSDSEDNGTRPIGTSIRCPTRVQALATTESDESVGGVTPDSEDEGNSAETSASSSEEGSGSQSDSSDRTSVDAEHSFEYDSDG